MVSSILFQLFLLDVLELSSESDALVLGGVEGVLPPELEGVSLELLGELPLLFSVFPAGLADAMKNPEMPFCQSGVG